MQGWDTLPFAKVTDIVNPTSEGGRAIRIAHMSCEIFVARLVFTELLASRSDAATGTTPPKKQRGIHMKDQARKTHTLAASHGGVDTARPLVEVRCLRPFLTERKRCRTDASPAHALAWPKREPMFCTVCGFLPGTPKPPEDRRVLSRQRWEPEPFLAWTLPRCSFSNAGEMKLSEVPGEEYHSAVPSSEGHCLLGHLSEKPRRLVANVLERYKGHGYPHRLCPK
jgi:hypothetical protein